MKRLFLLFATFVACLGLQAQFSYTNIDNFESGSTNATVLWSGAAAVVNNSTGTTGSKVLQVTDNAGYPFVNIPVSFESGKTWTDYDGIELSIYPKSGTIAGSGSKAVGLDLSLLKAYENAGVTYKDASGSTISDVISWVGQNKGVNYVRIRLFVDPTSNYAKALAGGSSYMNQLGGDLATVKVLGKRVKDAGLKFLLDIQYSDGWADPGKQLMPESWTSTCTSQTALQNKVYSYTKDVLNQLVAYGATPDMVQVGNEITYGMFYTSYDTPAGNYTNGGITASYSSTNAGRAGIHCFATYWADNTPSQDSYWVNLCNVIKKGCQAVREVCPSAKIMLHTERSAYTDWKATASGYTNMYLAEMFYQKMQEKSVDYDVIGLSYYPEDHGTMDKLNTILSALESRFPAKEIMLAEYGYSNNYYRGNNKPGTIGYYRRNDTNNSCPLAQKEFISALISMLNSHSRVKGMFYWFAEENESTNAGPYAGGYRNSGLWANESTNYASNKTSTAYSATKGCALPALDVLADFQDASSVVTKSAYYAQTWLKFYDAAGTASYLHKKVGLNVEDPYGADFSGGLDRWYTVRFGFNTDSIAAFASAVGSTPSSINLELRNYTNPSETNNDFYLDNVRFYKAVNESYALDFEDGTVGYASSAVHDGFCYGSQVVANNPKKAGINTSNKVMTVTNTWQSGCDLYQWYVNLPANLSLYDSIYMDVYPINTDTWVTLWFNDGSSTKIYDGADFTSWSANTWHRLAIPLSSLSDMTATRMYFGMWASGYSIDNITFHKAPEIYTITWDAATNGGTTAATTTNVTEGNALGTLPTATKTGYTFSGWFSAPTGGTQITASTVPTASVTYYAQFTPNTNTAYTVRHLWQNINDNDYTLHESESKTGTTGAQTAATAKTYTGFTAKAFSQSTIAANGSTVVDIYYDRKTYTITWKDGDNQTIETDNNVRYGATPSYNGATPTKTATAQYTFAFNGTWSPAIAEVTGNQTYVAQFEATLNKYTIRFLNWNGVELYTMQVEYGTTPVYEPLPPTKPQTDQYKYTFAGWDPELAPVTGDATYTAVFTESLQVYEVCFFNDDEILECGEWEYGSTPVYRGPEPTKAPDDTFFYTFCGWGEIHPVNGDNSYSAQFCGTWRYYDGVVINSSDPTMGTVAANPQKDTYEYGEEVTVTATANEGYHFTEWQDEEGNTVSTETTTTVTVTANTTITAVFEPNTNTRYLVHHLQQNLNDDLYTLVETDTLYGTTGRLTQVETVRRNYQGFYIKYCEDVPIAADGSTELNALYDRLTYSVRWIVENAERLDTLRYGAMPDYGSVPTKQGNAQYTYTFAGWDPEVVTVTADATYRAIFSSEVNRYTVTFHANGHATDPEQASVEYGRTVNCTTLYADDGWIFDGWFREAGCQTPWDCLQDVVTADIDLYAKWIPSENMFYTVNYWQQNIYDDDYTLVEFEQIKGTTGQMTQAEAKTYTGFTMLPFSQVPIAPNTEVNIYYDRLRYEVNFVVEGVAVQTDSVRYYGSAEYRGETPTKPETDTHYYTFWCWDKATNMPIVADVTFTALFNEYSKGGGTGLESVVITESGISGPKGMRIYDYTGKDVTNAMDHLYQGTYIIVLDGKTKKVMIP